MLSAELNRGRWIGVEYEMTLPLVGSGAGPDIQRVLAEVLTANGLRAIARGYSHSPIPPGIDLAVEYDSSVHGESKYDGIRWFSVELKTRILNGIDDWERIIPKALDICQYLGARVNQSCGHHVHLAIPEVNADPSVIRSLYNLVRRIEPVIYGLVAPSRSTSGYCRPISDPATLLHNCESFDQFRVALRHWTRYLGLNLTHLFSESGPRVEFRWHQGTLDPQKARHWLRFLLQLVEHAVTRNCQATEKQLPNDRTGIERLLISTGLKVNSRIYSRVCPELRTTGQYLLSRWKQFNGKVALSSVKAKPKSEAAEAVMEVV